MKVLVKKIEFWHVSYQGENFAAGRALVWFKEKLYLYIKSNRVNYQE